MPKQKGLIKIKGTLNGVSYYQLKGVDISRRAVGPSKERIQTDPVFVNVKHNNQEFGGASSLSKTIRQGLGKTAIAFKDSHMASRLTGVCSKIIQKGSGTHGQREAHINNNPEALIGFQLNNNQAFNQIFTAKPRVTSHNNRNNITITIPKISKKHLIKAPKKATHVQFTVALCMVSNTQWQSQLQSYQPVQPECHGIGTSQQTIPLLCKIEHTNIQIQLETAFTNQNPTNIAITVWLGIQFLRLQDTQFKPVQSVKAMQCIAVL
ncbi:hypothetical protein [Confluentibacter flavum]|uniref:Uncharacterized protein n=1 Tax=Confluentibacter flavum TaxID=1909700 RepID=A0A2N3HPX3_9FLAO|nr:hypothetical protein [Confluentibacter flavum]PKQ47005.1 hypothetical protein CSW08_00105 [Confluentibacter flavum]